jgi:hypothetical protein
MPKHLVNRRVKRLGVVSLTGVRDGLSALRFERFEVEHTGRVEPSCIAFSSEELAGYVGGRRARPRLTTSG